jgi:hypothetical protein
MPTLQTVVRLQPYRFVIRRSNDHSNPSTREADSRVHRPCVLALCMLMFLCAGAAADPRIAIEPQELDMGRVKQGDFVEKPLVVRNLGDTPLMIERIVTSCPCTTVSPLSTEEATITPGDSRVLTVRYAADESAGDGGAAVVVYSNDPALPAVVTDLTVFIEVLVVVSPPEGVYWGLAPRGFPVNKELLIRPGDISKDIELISVSCSVPGVGIESEKVEDTDQRFLRLTFELDADLPLGSLDAELAVRVRMGDELVDLTIPFRGDVLGDLFLSPPAIISPKTAYSQGQRISEITVSSSTGGEAPEIVGAMAVGPVKALIDKNDSSEESIVGVYAADNAPGGPQSATVYVMTTSKDEPIVSVPIYFRMGSPVTYEPDHLVLHEGHSGREIHVKHASGGAITITNIRYEADSLHAEIRTAGQATTDDPAIVFVKAADSVDPAKRSTIMVIETDTPGAERILIPAMILP